MATAEKKGRIQRNTGSIKYNFARKNLDRISSNLETKLRPSTFDAGLKLPVTRAIEIKK